MVGIALAAVLLLGALPAAAQSVTLQVWGVQATTEGRDEPHFDSALAPVREALRDLPFDTFRSLLSRRAAYPLGEETRVPVTRRYTLVLKPLSVEDDGRVRLDIKVLMKPPEDSKRKEPVVALSSVVVTSPRKEVRLGGLKLDEGQLVILVAS